MGVGFGGWEGGDEIGDNVFLGRGEFVVLDEIDGDLVGEEMVLVVFE